MPADPVAASMQPPLFAEAAESIGASQGTTHPFGLMSLIFPNGCG
jgi:hypothetical protein